MSAPTTSLEDLLNAAYRYAHALCAHAEMAEDLVHEGWLRVVKKHGPKPDKALLFRVIRNLFIDDLRHKNRFPSDTLDEQTLIDQTASDPSYYVSEDRVLAKGLDDLRSIEREVLFLWVFEGHTAAEIATLTSQSRGTVLSQIHRTKGKLKKHLAQHEQQGLHLVEDTRLGHSERAVNGPSQSGNKESS